MPDTDSITLVKESPYRGQPEEWSNTYHLDGTTPTTTAGWRALGEAIWAIEKGLYRSTTKLKRIYGYEAGNEVSVAQVDYMAPGETPITGTATFAEADTLPGDAAVMMRGLAGTNAKGKKVYLRKYFHFTAQHNSVPDFVNANSNTVMNALGAKLTDGSLPGGMKWVGPQGRVCTTAGGTAYVTTRTLKRRGKRPTPAG